MDKRLMKFAYANIYSKNMEEAAQSKRNRAQMILHFFAPPASSAVSDLESDGFVFVLLVTSWIFVNISKTDRCGRRSWRRGRLRFPRVILKVLALPDFLLRI